LWLGFLPSVKFEDGSGVIRSRRLKKTIHWSQGTDNYLQRTKQKTKD